MRGRHRRPNSVPPGFVGGRRDYTPTLRAPADDQEICPTGALRILEPCDLHIEGVAVDEQDPTRSIDPQRVGHQRESNMIPLLSQGSSYSHALADLLKSPQFPVIFISREGLGLPDNSVRPGVSFH